MTHDNRVVWSEGMFLRVQHFQQADRWAESLVARASRFLRPFGWGLSSLSINRQLLGTGRLGVSAISGIFPDGTAFAAPDSVDLPPPLELAEGEKNKIVYLVLPTYQAGNFEMGGADGEHRHLRYHISDEEITDTNAGSAISAPVSLARLALSFKLEGDDLTGYERIAVARIVEVRQDQSVVLDDDFVPSVINCAASSVLSSTANEILGIVRHRAEAIADRMGDPSIRGSAEITDFQFLQVLNRFEPLLEHKYQNIGTEHPESFYGLLVQLAGELATFTTERRRAIRFAGYRQGDLQSSFEPVVAELRRSLSTVLERTAFEIMLEQRKHGIRVGIVEDRSLLSAGTFVLAARSELPQDALRSSLPRQIKVGPVERIAELINVALPGIDVAALPVAPRQLPHRPGTVYFELDRNGPLWKQLSATGGIAVHVAGEFPALELELWAIRS